MCALCKVVIFLRPWIVKFRCSPGRFHDTPSALLLVCYSSQCPTWCLSAWKAAVQPSATAPVPTPAFPLRSRRLPALPPTGTFERPGQHCPEPAWLPPTGTVLRSPCCACLAQACRQLLLRPVTWAPLSLASAFHTDTQAEGLSLPHVPAQPRPPLLPPHLPSPPAQGCSSRLTPRFHRNNVLTGLTPNSPPDGIASLHNAPQGRSTNA